MANDNKRKYDIEYRKKHKRQFNVDLNIDEHKELVELLKDNELSNVQFVRLAFKKLKEGYFKLER